jgi:hypothetical protein
MPTMFPFLARLQPLMKQIDTSHHSNVDSMILPKAETLDMATLGSLDMEEIVQFDVRLLLTDVNLLHQRLQAGEERKHGWHITICPGLPCLASLL